MDRRFEEGIGRFRAQQFKTIAENESCKRVRKILNAYNAEGKDAAKDPNIRHLAAVVARDMYTPHGLTVPVRRRIGNFGETHSIQVIEVDGTVF